MKKTTFLIIALLLVGIGLGANTYKPTVITKKCTGCTECFSACPFDAITMVDDKAVINPDKCTGCMACVRVCSWGSVK